MTHEKKRQLDQLAQGLDKSYSAIMSEALDALQAKISGRKARPTAYVRYSEA